MDRQGAKHMRASLEDKLGKEFNGHEVSLGRITFDDNGCTVKLTLSRMVDGIAETPERIAYKEYASYTDLKEEWLDKPVTWAGSRYTIRGYNHKARKYPIKVEKDGKMYKFSTKHITSIYSASA